MVCPKKALKVSTLSNFLKFSLVSHCQLKDTSITPIKSAIFAGNQVGLYKVGLWVPLFLYSAGYQLRIMILSQWYYDQIFTP